VWVYDRLRGGRHSDRVGEGKCTRFPYRPVDTRRVAKGPG
jgi:hypothetical protein